MCDRGGARLARRTNRRGLLLLAVAQVAVLALFVLWLRSYIATETPA